MFSSNKFRQGQDKNCHFSLLFGWVSFRFVGCSHLASLWLQCCFNWHLVIKKEANLAFLRTVSSVYFSDSFRMLLREMNRVLWCPCPSPHAHHHLYWSKTSVLMMVFKNTSFLCVPDQEHMKIGEHRQDFPENPLHYSVLLSWWVAAVAVGKHRGTSVTVTGPHPVPLAGEDPQQCDQRPWLSGSDGLLPPRNRCFFWGKNRIKLVIFLLRQNFLAFTFK